MQAVSVQTTQNIELEYPLAGVGERMLALLLDLLIIASFYIIVFGGLGIASINVPSWMIVLITIAGYLYRFFFRIALQWTNGWQKRIED